MKKTISAIFPLEEYFLSDKVIELALALISFFRETEPVAKSNVMVFPDGLPDELSERFKTIVSALERRNIKLEFLNKDVNSKEILLDKLNIEVAHCLIKIWNSERQIIAHAHKKSEIFAYIAKDLIEQIETQIVTIFIYVHILTKYGCMRKESIADELAFRLLQNPFFTLVRKGFAITPLADEDEKEN